MSIRRFRHGQGIHKKLIFMEGPGPLTQEVEYAMISTLQEKGGIG